MSPMILFEIGSEKRILESSTVHDLVQHYSKGRVFMLSGTLGTPPECAEANKKYQLSLFSVPRHKTNKRVDLPPRITANREENDYALSQYIQEASAKQHPVVVFCKTTEEALRLEKYLKETLPAKCLGEHDEKLQLITAEISGTPLENDRVAKAGTKSMITISTKMIGRGTDIHVHEEYPLEILCSYLPTSREYWQMVGRAGRYGQKGLTRLVLNGQELPSDLSEDNRFFFAKRAYLQEKQRELSMLDQQARLLDHCRSELLADMTRFFFLHVHAIQDQSSLQILVESWGNC